MIRLALSAAMALSLAACMEDQTVATSVSCPAEDLQHLIGTDVALANVDWPANKTRISGENDPVTMDFRGDRLNIVHKADGTIIRVTCG